ncbi:MAG TPA: hypothetical protein VMU55_08985, partial [Solirubrobacteraceae bacterium]|nr:hypothetical protein [Solirubrobacteraceae bacterium]
MTSDLAAPIEQPVEANLADGRRADGIARGRLKRLLNYIAEQLKDINPRGIKLDHAEQLVLHPPDLAGLPGVTLDRKTEGDHVWLRVERLAADRPPKVPEAFEGSIRESSDPDGAEAQIDETAFKAKLAKVSQDLAQEARRRLEERSLTQLKQALATYQGVWKSWAEGERPRRRTIKLYGSLFALKHSIEAAETARALELVWGVAMVAWRLQDTAVPIDYSYPLLTQALEISVDDESMAIEVRPRAVPPRVELDAMVHCGVTGAAEVDRALREELQRPSAALVTPFDAGSYEALAKLAATNLDSEGRCIDVLARNESVPPVGPHLVVTDAWAVFSRPRTRSVLIEDLARLEEALLEIGALPAGPAALVTPASDVVTRGERMHFRGVSSRGRGPNCQELYFPLPYNDEQVTVVERLERAAGVTVQGPPGTGKTHTIANIICHYLATGRRVLVTSKGE